MAKRLAGCLVTALGLLVTLPAIWNLVAGSVQATVLVYQQMEGTALAGGTVVICYPIIFLAYPLYWAVALGGVYYMTEQFIATLGIIILLKGLDLSGYEPSTRRARNNHG